MGCGEVGRRESAHNILSNTVIAPAGTPTLCEPAKADMLPCLAFTAESGMVNLPYYHSFVHVDHFYRG